MKLMEDSVTTPPDAVAAAMKLTPLMCRFPCSTRQKAVPFISHSLAHLWSTPEVNRKQFRGPLEHRKLLIIQVMLVDVKMANRPVKIAVIVHERQAVIRAHYPLVFMARQPLIESRVGGSEGAVTYDKLTEATGERHLLEIVCPRG